MEFPSIETVPYCGTTDFQMLTGALVAVSLPEIEGVTLGSLVELDIDAKTLKILKTEKLALW